MLTTSSDQHHKKKYLRLISHKILKYLRLPHHNKLNRDQKHRQREEGVAIPGPVLTHHMVTPGDQIAQEQVQQKHDEIMSIHQTDNDVKRQKK
ncbi:2776_t:CDS:1, partial [Racocetra persica]